MSSTEGTIKVKQGLAQMLKGGVIMDVMTVEQAKIAEAAGMTYPSIILLVYRLL